MDEWSTCHVTLPTTRDLRYHVYQFTYTQGQRRAHSAVTIAERFPLPNTTATRGFRNHQLPTTQTVSQTRTASSHPNRAVHPPTRYFSRSTPQTTRRPRYPYPALSTHGLSWPEDRISYPPFPCDRNGKKNESFLTNRVFFRFEPVSLLQRRRRCRRWWIFGNFSTCDFDRAWIWLFPCKKP